MQAKTKKNKKIRVVFVLFESVGCGVGRQVVVFGAVLERAPTFCAEGGTAAPYSNMRGRFV